MKRFFLTCHIFLAVLSPVYCQSVGLVLSGGGAKGAVHIGFIKALEENEIPIDYVGGTSVGAIVGSLYAMGYSPEEMLALFLSDDFRRWQSGTVEDGHDYYFRKREPTPEFVHFTVDVKDSVKVNSIKLPVSLVNPIQMNQAFMGLYSQATAYSNGNFDNLFVPFLCVASDIFNKKPVIFREGDLGNAVRASMSFPFVFKPIQIDSIPLYDGGIYDNFPVRPVRRAFDPDFLIGCAVAGGRVKKPSEQSLYEQIENMIMQPTNYRISAEEGHMERFRLEDVNLLDFHKGKELFDIGYERGLLAVDSIKQRVFRNITESELKSKREAFKRELPPLLFKNIYISGVTESQALYVESQFRHDRRGYFSMEDFKDAYFKLLSDSKISEIIPHAIYNEAEKCFDLQLDVTVNNEIIVAFGGNISSSNANQLYLGLGYQSLGQSPMDFNLDMQVGNAFNGIQLSGRLELPTRIPLYIKGIGKITSRKYFQSERLFIEDDLPSFIQQQETFFKLQLVLPFLTRTRCEITTGYGNLTDKYYQSRNVDYSKTSFDRSINQLFLASLAVRRNTLDAKQYPTRGKNHLLTAQFLSGKEQFYAANQNDNLARELHPQSWIQVKGLLNNYHLISPRINLGYLFEGSLSSKNLLSNYTASIVQAPAFTPTPHSKLVFNESFRSNEYLAGGITPVFKVNDMFHLRADYYCFCPIRKMAKDSQNKPFYEKPFSSINNLEYMAELSAVLRLPFMSIGLYGNRYSAPKGNWNLGLNIGFLIFESKFIE